MQELYICHTCRNNNTQIPTSHTQLKRKGLERKNYKILTYAYAIFLIIIKVHETYN